ncbi:hypothetical protein [Micromonospora sp. 15K316]|nr:hypothetical protein [Micromonospora sp. 15K316]
MPNAHHQQNRRARLPLPVAANAPAAVYRRTGGGITPTSTG